MLPIGLLATAAFLSSAGARIVDPLLHVIATDFGTTVSGVSVVVAGFTLPYGLAQILLGPLGDRLGKLRVMLGALVGYALFSAACATASSLPMLVVLRAAAGATSAGLIPVAMAYIGDMVPYEQRQVTLSRFLTGTVLAQALAGPVGGVFGSYLGWRGVFVLIGVAAGVAAAVLALRIRRLPDRQAGAATSFNPRNYLILARNRFARLLLLGAMADGMLFVGSFPFLAPYLHERFGLPYAQVGLLLAFFGLGAFAYTRLARVLLRTLGEGGMQLLGGVLMAAAVALAVLTPAWPVFILVQTMLGLGFFTLHGVLQARATELLPKARATAVATFAFMLFLGQSLGALLIGLGIARLGYQGAFLLDAAGILLLAVALSALVWRPVSAASPAAPAR